MNPRNHNHYPYLTIHRHNDPQDPATDAGTATETPAYLVPVLAVYDDPAAAAQRERATILYCQGHRTADIAAQLNVPVSTVRSWLTDARYLLTAELRVSREELQLRAIESARALAAEAWTAYERDRDPPARHPLRPARLPAPPHHPSRRKYPRRPPLRRVRAPALHQPGRPLPHRRPRRPARSRPPPGPLRAGAPAPTARRLPPPRPLARTRRASLR